MQTLLKVIPDKYSIFTTMNIDKPKERDSKEFETELKKLEDKPFNSEIKQAILNKKKHIHKPITK